ncbi:unnamed protein product [Phaeothamnion confervicola]
MLLHAVTTTTSRVERASRLCNQVVIHAMWGYKPREQGLGEHTDALLEDCIWCLDVEEIMTSDHVDVIEVENIAGIAIVWPASEAEARHGDMAGQDGVYVCAAHVEAYAADGHAAVVRPLAAGSFHVCVEDVRGFHADLHQYGHASATCEELHLRHGLQAVLQRTITASQGPSRRRTVIPLFSRASWVKALRITASSPQKTRTGQRLREAHTLSQKAINFAKERTRVEIVSFENEEDLRRLAKLVGRTAHVRFSDARGRRGALSVSDSHILNVATAVVLAYEMTSATSRLVVKVEIVHNVALRDATWAGITFAGEPYAWFKERDIWTYYGSDVGAGGSAEGDAVAAREENGPLRVKVLWVGRDRVVRDRYTVWFYVTVWGDAVTDGLRAEWTAKIEAFMTRSSFPNPADTVERLFEEPARVFEGNIRRFN